MENGEPLYTIGRLDGEPKPEDVTLEGNVPFYHLFLPDKPSVSKDETFEAKDVARQWLRDNPAVVLKCQGQSIETARAILDKERISDVLGANEEAAAA